MSLTKDHLHFTIRYRLTPSNPQKVYFKTCNPYNSLRYYNRHRACVHNYFGWGGFNLKGKYTQKQEPYVAIKTFKPQVIYEMVFNFSHYIMQYKCMQDEDSFRYISAKLVQDTFSLLGFSKYNNYSIVFHHFNGAHHHLHVLMFEKYPLKNRYDINRYALKEVQHKIVKLFKKRIEKAMVEYNNYQNSQRKRAITSKEQQVTYYRGNNNIQGFKINNTYPLKSCSYQRKKYNREIK